MGSLCFGRAFLTERKKKAIGPSASEQAQKSSFKSILAPGDQTFQSATPMFLPPEAFGSSMSLNVNNLPDDLSGASSWDVAIRYHELKARPSMSQRIGHLRRLSAQAILDKAQQILGSVVHPSEVRNVPWDELPGNAEQPDFDMDETFENSPLAMASVAGLNVGDYPLTGADVWMTYRLPRKQPLVITVDTSLSMTGEKLALTAVALAVVLLQFPDDPVGIVAFENTAQILKRPTEKISLQQLVERFLDVPAQGYTHLEDGMIAALKIARSVDLGHHGRPPSTVLLTDGKYTAGRDPAYLAPRFPHLVVMKMGKERASLQLCRELAQKGNGALREVPELEVLPQVMYGVVKDLLRGRSLS